MSIKINITYRGKNGSAQAFAREMTESGTVAAIRAEDGNEAYDYYQPLDDADAILLIDRWRNHAAIDAHHASPMMGEIARLRDKYDLHMEVRRFADLDKPASDSKFVRQ